MKKRRDKLILTAVLTLLCLAWPISAETPLVISEFQAVNSSTLADEDGDYSDWIEVYNTATTHVGLLGWSLTDSEDESRKWLFPATDIPPCGFLVVFASGKDRRVAGQELHTTFKLSADGEYLALVDPSGATADHAFSPGFPRQYSDMSYGLTWPDTNGTTGTISALTAFGAPRYFATPTPRATNDNAFIAVVEDTKFSVDRGFFFQPFEVAITTKTADATIRYTLDGSVPSETSGSVYSNAIPITRTMILRAAAFKTGYMATDVDTHTYVFPHDVIRQPAWPDGFPTAWMDRNGSPAHADYEMDPEIVDHPLYTNAMIAALTALPVLSLVTDLDNLFDPQTGIYSNPLQDGEDWERPTSAEFFHANGRKGLQIDCGLRVYGGSSRNTDFPKKTLRLLFKGVYGTTKLQYPLFGDDPFGADAAEEFDTIILRGGHNNTWIHRHWFQAFRSQYIRDQWVRDSQLAMGSPSCHGTYVHLYINGIYWGIFNPTERADASFLATYFGGEKEHYDAQNVTLAIDGDTSGWTWLRNKANAGLAANTDYEAMSQRLDIDQFTDYMLLNFYVGNDDWDGHNWYAGRRRSPPGPYRLFSWDAELSISRHVTSAPPPQPEYDIVLNRNRTTISNDNKPSRLFTKLRANAEYRLRCADRIQKHMFNGGALTPAETVKRWLVRHNQIYRALPAESARWGDYKRDVDSGKYSPDEYDLFHPEDHYLAHQEWLLNGYFQWRHAIVLQQLRDIGCYPDVEAPVLTPHGGLFNPTLALVITADAPIYYTLDGRDPREYGTGNPVGAVYSTPVPITRATQVKARTRNGATWSALTQATFSPVSLPLLRITEIMYHPQPPSGNETNRGFAASDFEFIELQNQEHEVIGLAGLRFVKGIRFDFTTSPVQTLAPGEHVVIVRNLHAFTNRYTAWPDMQLAGEFVYPDDDLSDNCESILLVDGANRTLLDFDYKDSWYDNTDGDGFSLVPTTGTNDPDRKAAWRPSGFTNGSPGEADPAADTYPPYGSVVVNEVLAHQDHGLAGSGDWIEIKNVSGATLSVGGWFLSDQRAHPRKYVIPPGTTLPPGDLAVFTEHGHFGTNAPGMQDNGFALNEGGGTVVLSSGTNGVLTGYRAELTFDASERDTTIGRYTRSDGKVHVTALATATPEAENSPPRVGPVILSEIMYHPPASGHEYVEIRNTAQTPVALYDTAHPANTWNLSGAIDYSFPTGTVLAAGESLLVIPTNRTTFALSYPDLPPATPTYGPFSGKMDNAGESLRLNKPGDPEPVSEKPPVILVEKVTFNDRPPWPTEADGLGASLERRDPGAYADDPANWIAGQGLGTPGRQRHTVAVARPSNRAVYFAPATLTVEADVNTAHATGTIDAVSLHVGTQLLATCTAPPYVADLAAVTAGTYAVWADLLAPGGVTTSDTTTVSLLTLASRSPGSVSDDHAVLRGRLSGPAGARIQVCWGTTDAGTNHVDYWEHAAELGWLTNVTFALPVDLPPSGVPLVYRCRAETLQDDTWTEPVTVSAHPYAAWPHHMRVAFPGYTGTRPLTNFPALVRLGAHIPGFSYSSFASQTGADLRFTDDTGIFCLNHEIDVWDTNGISTVWVQLPRLANTNTAIQSHWGHPAATHPLPSALNGSVWSNGFKTVWHAGAEVVESVTRQHRLMDYGSRIEDGAIGRGRTVDGVNNHLDLVYVGAPWYWINMNHATVSMWVRPAARASMTVFGLRATGQDITMRTVASRVLTWQMDVGDQTSPAILTEPDIWSLLTLQFDHGTARASHNGSAPSVIGTYTPFVPVSRCFLGAVNINGTAAEHFAGTIDEVRLSSVVRSADWIQAEYATVAHHAVFTSYAILPGYSDLDSDGLGDSWEWRHFGSTNAVGGGASDDYDGDGSPNADEFVAGTDPTNAASAFALHISHLPSGVVVRFWTAAADADVGNNARLYSLDRAEGMATGSWQRVSGYTDIAGRDDFLTYTNRSPAGNASFFRARARLSSP